jgi:hypothetical protein
MERMLLKMANQLNAYDEASLMGCWEKYAMLVGRFEPTKRWEEAVLVFSLIQAVRFKNQLFNQHFASGRELARRDAPLPGFAEASAWLAERGQKKSGEPETAPSKRALAEGKAVKRCKVLRFKRGKGDKPV